MGKERGVGGGKEWEKGEDGKNRRKGRQLSSLNTLFLRFCICGW